MEQKAFPFELFARCASGFESVLARELRSLHMQRVRPLKGGVAFFGALEDAYRACLWSRVATRVQLVIGRVDARDANVLYEGARAIAWEELVKPGATIAVKAHGNNPQLRNTKFSALKVKDALVDRVREQRGRRPDVDAKNPDFAVDISIYQERATLYCNLSGSSLHRRGYREDGVQVAAPLKETLAAGMLLAAGWEDLVVGRAQREGPDDGPERVPSDAERDALSSAFGFVDPLCGSGTLAIEAALIAADIAPGLLRARWGFEGILFHDAYAWERVRAEAQTRCQQGLRRAKREGLRMVAGDCDARAVELARANAHRAGVAEFVEFHVCDAADLPGRWGKLGGKGLLASNPPYGQRLLSVGELDGVYASLSQAIEALPAAWTMALISPDELIDMALGQSADTCIDCYNGPLEARLRIYRTLLHGQLLDIVSLGGIERKVKVAESNSKQFADRLRKVAKERFKWARKEGVSCLRLYDADLPDYALSVDAYTACGQDEAMYVRVAEYQAPSSVDAARAVRRLHDALSIVPAVLDVDPLRVFTKVRKHAKGGGQYRDAVGKAQVIAVEESGYRFEVDLGSYLDTGLFLDHRITRRMLEGMACGTRFANLFAYTGTASVYAAGGGALATTTVDASRTYLAWAQRNMEGNGFAGPAHRFVRADVRQWLEEEWQRIRARQSQPYDLVFCDPPTFSNSKASKFSFSVQRDHVALLVQIARVLAPGGTIVFSCNLRTFKVDAHALEAAGLQFEDVSARTIPHDFARTPKIHHCYLVQVRLGSLSSV